LMFFATVRTEMTLAIIACFLSIQAKDFWSR
jgi:hypothetical protein